VIELQEVSKVFPTPDGGQTAAVRDLDLEVRDKETLCLIGRSGCGKTTTLRLMNRLIEPSRGRVLVDGIDVRSRDVIELRRKMGYVIQTGGLFPHMNVAENVGLVCTLEGWRSSRVTRRVDELLELVNLAPSEFASRFPRELSGGQRQRVGVARALALDPPHLLMDEPFGALDPITRDELHGEFLQLKATVTKTIVLVTHDLGEAFHLGDRVALLDRGTLVQIGEDRDFSERPATPFVDAFLKSHLRGEVAHA
jgi:osmoprotectant transport system ATP-binding protein